MLARARSLQALARRGLAWIDSVNALMAWSYFFVADIRMPTFSHTLAGSGCFSSRAFP